MNQQEINDLFETLGIVRRGHFLRASGRHADHYVQCAKLFENPAAAQPAVQALAQRFEQSGVQTVLSAAVGGIILCYETARALGARSIYCERRDGALALRRGFQIQPGEKVLIVEDEVTTGASVREMMEIVRALHGEIAGIGCLVDKAAGRVELGQPLVSLYAFRGKNYAAAACPLCAQQVPLENV